jgi:hypothetical protein
VRACPLCDEELLGRGDHVVLGADEDGSDFQARVPEGCEPALTAKGRWPAADNLAWAAGTPLAKHPAKPW